MKLDETIKIDFDNFWDFWDALEDHAAALCSAESADDLSSPNRMMIAAYAANVWFQDPDRQQMIAETFRPTPLRSEKPKSPSRKSKTPIK